MRTSNPKLRRNQWYENPSEKIKIKFNMDDGESFLTYNVVKGDKKGRYVVTVKSTKAYSGNDPNYLAVVIEGETVKSYLPKLIVYPGSVKKAYVTD